MELEHPITTTSLAECISQIEADIADVRFVIQNQKLLNEEYVKLVKEMINQQSVSPHIGSNSPKVRKTTMTEGTIEKNGATLRTYKRKKNTTPTTIGIDPDYLPIPTPPSSPEGGTFRLKRRNKQRRSGSTPAPKGETPKGKRKLFNSGSIFGVGQSKGEKTHITSSSIPAVQYAEHKTSCRFAMSIGASGGRRLGKNIPRGMSLTFFPTKDMKIVGLDLCAAAYIFNMELDQDELLVRSPHCAITRGALKTLEPKKPVVDDVSTNLSADSACLHAGWKLHQDSLVLADNLLTCTLRNDCSMYVAQWMIMYHLWNSYEAEKITDYSRMRLAVDMVLKYNNDKCMEVIQVALEYWKNLTNGSPATN
ncbi:hypothetical protein AHAS_Ahas17G0150000 [Arachis hypogaea]